MENIYWVIIVFAVIIALFAPTANKKRKKDNSKSNEDVPIESFAGCYKPKILLTQNEKTQYKKIKEVTDELGLTVFTKVRLLDLLEPQKQNRSLLYKVQAKHIDFVITDQSYMPKFLIEIDDSSHNRTDRQKRDEFVNFITKDVGYVLYRTYSIDADKLKEDLKNTFKIPTSTTAI